MAGPERPRLDLLLAEAGWVEGLARGILEPEDAAQDARLAALKQAPPGNARAWLAAVARNALRKAMRAERRRSKRERAVARSEAQPSTLEVVERFSTHHAVATAVLELEEPLRETILLRYYEGLTLAAIGERTGVAVATVADRVRAGEERLRERLRRRFGGDEGVVVALLPFLDRRAPGGVAPEASPGPPAGVSAARRLASASSTPGVAVGIACVLLVAGTLAGFAWLRGRGRVPVAALEAPLAVRAPPKDSPAPLVALTSTEARRLVTLAAPVPAESLASTAGSTAPGTLRVRIQGPSGLEPVLRVRPERTDVAVPASQRADGGVALFDDLAPGLWTVEHAFGPPQRVHVRSEREERLELALHAGRALAGNVVDDSGAPVPFADVWLLPQGPEEYAAGRWMPTVVGSEHCVARADAAGRFQLPSCGGAELVGATAAGHAPSLGLPLAGRGGTCVELTLRLERAGGALAGRVVDATGAPLAGATVHLDAASAADVVVEGQRVSRAAPLFRAVTDGEGRFHYPSVRTGARGLLVSAPGHAPWRGTVNVTPGAPGASAVEVVLENGARVHGRVTDESGAPQPGVLVFGAKRRWATLPDERYAVATRTGADGAYELHGVPADAAWLVVEGGARGRYAELLQLEAAEELRVDVVLSQGLPIRGRAVDERGRPLAGAVVRVWRAGDGASRACRSDAEGRFVIADCEEEQPYELQLEEHGLCVHQAHLTPSTDEVRIVVAERGRPSATLAGLLVDAADQNGTPLVAATIELTEALSGRTLTRAAETRADGSFVSEPVPPGEYAVAVRANGRPPVELTLRLRAGERLDLGTLVSEPGVELVLDLARSDGAPLYFLTARVLDASGATVELRHGHDAALILPLVLALPAGDFELQVEAAGAAPLHAPLHVGAESAPRRAFVLEPLVR